MNKMKNKENFITNWETNEKLSLSQRENNRHMEDTYLRNKFSKKEKIVNCSIPTEKKNYLLYEDTLYEFKSKNTLFENKEQIYYLFTRGSTFIVIPEEKILKEGIIWKVLS
jgi:hypothetical protein